jgi:phage gp29-like protein
MAKRSPKRPPVARKKQRAASAALVKAQPRTEVLTLQTIADIRKRRALQGVVRGGTVSRVNGEYGASGTLNVWGRILQEDYNPLFDGKSGLVLYDQMDRSDGQVGAAGDIIKLPIRAANWRVIPPEKATATEKQIAEEANFALFGEGIWPAGEGWDFHLRHLLSRVTHGFGMLEKIWMFDEDRGILRWRRLAPRLPRTVDRFIVNPDGTLREIIQYVAMAGTGAYEYKTIPAEYAILSVRERDGDNYFGKSIYRRLYKHWFYKDEAYRIDGIRLDRFGVGIPVAKIEEGHILEEDELNEIELLLQALRSHERAYIIEPPKVTFRIMVPEGGHGGVTGLMESVEHHDTMIVRGILAQFMSSHAEGLNTNRTRTLADIFLHALKAEARSLAVDLSSQALRPFCDLNFNMLGSRYPQIEVTGIGDLTADQFAASLAPLVSARVITPEDSLEDVIRKVFGLPPLPDGWKRGERQPAIAAPGAPGANGGAVGEPGGPSGEGEPGTQEPEVEPVDLASSLRTLAAAIEHAVPAHPPQPPDIVVHVHAEGERGPRRIERDATGRIARIIREGTAGGQ